jgi:hypothetical protein
MSSSRSGEDASSSSDEEIPPASMPVGSGNKRRPPAGLSHHVSTGNEDEPSRSHHPIVGPGENDVLLGRGRPYQNYSGNKRMLHIVSQYKGQYSARPRDQKRAFVETVLDAVFKDGTKFLRRVEAGDLSSSWEEVDRTAAAEKVWHALRCKERPGQPRGKRKAGDETDLSPHGAEALTSDRQMQMPTSTTNTPSAHATLRDIQIQLGKAVAATNLLASLITKHHRPASSTGIGNAAAAPSAAPLYSQTFSQAYGNAPAQQSASTVAAAAPSAAPLYSQTFSQAYGNAPAQQSASTVAGLASHDWLRSLGALSAGDQSLPRSHINLPGLSSFPFVHPGRRHGLIDLNRVSAASVGTGVGQAPQSTNQNQPLMEAFNIVMQAAQQGALPPP